MDAVVNLGLPAPIDLQVSSSDMKSAYAIAQDLARKIRGVKGVSNAAYGRISVTQQFVDQTNLAADLSQTRYNLGLGSIVELSQAQLQQTEAQIQFAAAKYQYRIAQAVLRFQIAAP